MLNAHDKNIIFIDETKKQISLKDYDFIEYILKTRKPLMIIFDPTTLYIGKKVDMNSANEVRNILNPIVGIFERKVFKKVKKDTTRRDLSIALTLLLFVALITAVIGYLIPQLLESILSLITNAPKYFSQSEEFLKRWINNPDLDYASVSEFSLKFLNDYVK